MKIVLVSNYFNHHQKPFCEEMRKMIGGEFSFVSTGVMREERKKLGYAQDDVPEYVFETYGDTEKQKLAQDMINDADIVIAGSTPDEMLIQRLRSGKALFRYSERPFKRKASFVRRIYNSIRLRKRDLGDRNVYMLCAGAFAAKDFASMGLYKGRMYKWGYFPVAKEYDEDLLLSRKNRSSILWCGRFIDWKHPDDAVEVARRLKESGIEFHLNMIGSGIMENELRRLIEENDLSNCVQLLGSMPPDMVREHMEEAGIFLQTSDRKEGWGAVLNEAMNSACAVVAGDEIGSSSYLVKDGENGFVYRSGNVDRLYEKTSYLLTHPQKQEKAGKAAYKTIKQDWNAKTAAHRILSLAEHLASENNDIRLYEDGICSSADIEI